MAAIAVAYALGLYLVFLDDPRLVRLRERFPFESLESRAPRSREEYRSKGSLSKESAARLFTIEMDTTSSRYNRARKLQSLHERNIRLFADTPGFGVGRTARTLPASAKERIIMMRDRANEAVPQPASPEQLSEGPFVSPNLRPWKEEGLHRMHIGGIEDFADGRTFGYFKDIQHVAGFEAHRFSKLPHPEERWEVRRLELVGLLMHAEPVVYVSENLPNMTELGGAPVRPLDSFESAALDALRQGEDLLVAEIPAGMRMLGAVRAVRECKDCHGSWNGDLLGAFSYTLRRESPSPDRTLDKK
jgi:hypothetical protein